MKSDYKYEEERLMDQQPQPYEGEIDIMEYIKVINKHCKMIIALVLVSILFAGIPTLTKPSIYEASATFFPMNIKEYYGSQSESLAMRRQLNIEDLIMSILKSRKMADKIIEQLKLQDLWSKKLMVDTRKNLEKVTKITLEKNGIIRLSVQTKSPELSANIANAYVDNIDYFTSQLDIGAEKRTVQVIDRAVVPETRMPRGLINSAMIAGMLSLMAGVFLAFFMEFLEKSKKA